MCEAESGGGSYRISCLTSARKALTKLGEAEQENGVLQPISQATSGPTVDYQHIRRLCSSPPGSSAVDFFEGDLGDSVVIDKEGEFVPTTEESKLARQARAFETKGNQCMDSGRFRKAISYFEKAGDISRADGILYQNIAVAYHRLGNLPKARQAIQEALRREPDNARIQNNARSLGVSSYGPSGASLTQLTAPTAAPAVAADQRPVVKTNVLTIASLVLGIMTVLFGCANPIVGVPVAIGAFITGRMGSRRVKESDGAQSGEGLARAGMILGGVGLVLSLVTSVILIMAILIGRATQ